MTLLAPHIAPPEGGTREAAVSSGELSGQFAGVRVDLDRLRRVLPDRWRAFLKAHFSGHSEVQYMFGVDDRTARNWLEGNTSPRVEVPFALMQKRPDLIPAILELAA